MQPNVKDLAVVVTGAASGVGRATTLAFASKGARVFAVDLNAEGLAETARLADGDITTYAADLSDPENCAPVIEAAVAKLGRLDALCNIAGVLKIEPISEVTPQSWDLIYAVNVRAPFFLTKAAMPHLIESNGAVVFISSATAFRGYAYLSAYTSSKAAIAQLTRALAAEFIKNDVRINAIAPGAINTPMSQPGQFSESIDFDLLIRSMGIRPGVGPEEYTDMILYLASPDNKIVHGACINIDDGFAAT